MPLAPCPLILGSPAPSLEVPTRDFEDGGCDLVVSLKLLRVGRRELCLLSCNFLGLCRDLRLAIGVPYHGVGLDKFGAKNQLGDAGWEAQVEGISTISIVFQS